MPLSKLSCSNETGVRIFVICVFEAIIERRKSINYKLDASCGVGNIYKIKFLGIGTEELKEL